MSPHPLTEYCQQTVKGERCKNQAYHGRATCWQHMARKGHNPSIGQLAPTGAITRKQMTIKFYLKDGENPEDVRQRLSDIFRWRDGLTVTVEEKKL